jgi:hypothetical protein
MIATAKLVSYRAACTHVMGLMKRPHNLWVKGKKRSGAKTRDGTPCMRRELFKSGRCRNHGGLCTEPKTPQGKRRARPDRERVKSGLARVKATIDKNGYFITKSGKERKKLGRKAGYRPSDKHTKKVLEPAKDGPSYRLIGRNLGLSKNTVMQIVQREQQGAAA